MAGTCRTLPSLCASQNRYLAVMALSWYGRSLCRGQPGASRARTPSNRVHVVRAVDRDQPDMRSRRTSEPMRVVEPEIIDVETNEETYGLPQPSAEEMQAVMELAATMDPQERQEFFEYMQSRNWQDFEESLTENDLERNLAAMREAFGDQVDTPEFWDSAVWDPLVVDVLKSQLSISEVQLMDRVMGDSWERVGELDDADILQQLGTMSPAEQEMLLGILQKLQILKEQMEMSGLAGGFPGVNTPSSSSSSSSGFSGPGVIVDTTATTTTTSSSSSSTSGESSSRVSSGSSTEGPTPSSNSSSSSSSEVPNQGTLPGGNNMSKVKR